MCQYYNSFSDLLFSVLNRMICDLNTKAPFSRHRIFSSESLGLVYKITDMAKRTLKSLDYTVTSALHHPPLDANYKADYKGMI